MSIVIDRRLNAKKKSTVNRQRFLRRYKNHVKKAVEQVVNQRSITDVDRGGEISIPTKDLSEPFFHHGEGGATERVYPGNKDFNSGDRFARPRGGGGGGAGEGQASDGGEGMDDFVFQIDREELLEYLFEDLELPNLVEKELKESSDYKLKRAGFTNAGSPDKINIIRSLRGAHARRIALSGKERKEIRELKREIREMEVSPETTDKERVEALRVRIRELNAKIKRLPFIDEFDLKFNNMVKVPNPSSKAVMFCVMDVSGSMTRDIKDMAKRFFMLLYMFLERSYETVELVFIRHHAEARECNEHDFFYARETGGTVVSSALKLSNAIIDERYSPKDWNIYVAQASDGDNWEADCAKCDDLIRNKILSKVQFFSYVEITDRHHQALWHDYKAIEDEHPDRFAIQHIQEPGDIYPVFRKLFEKREA